jgi:hypothetical protein
VQVPAREQPDADPQVQSVGSLQVQPSEQELSAVQVQFPPQLQESVQAQESVPQVQPSVHWLSTVQVQSPVQVHSSVHWQPVESSPSPENGVIPAAAGTAKPSAASAIPAIRSLFTISPFWKTEPSCRLLKYILF